MRADHEEEQEDYMLGFLETAAEAIGFAILAMAGLAVMLAVWWLVIP